MMATNHEPAAGWLLVLAVAGMLLVGALVGHVAPDTDQGARAACLAEVDGGAVLSSEHQAGRATVVLRDQAGRTLTCRAEIVGEEWAARLAAEAR